MGPDSRPDSTVFRLYGTEERTCKDFTYVDGYKCVGDIFRIQLDPQPLTDSLSPDPNALSLCDSTQTECVVAVPNE